MNIKKGDTVKIIAGKDKGKTGKVSRVFPSSSKIIIEGANVAKKSIRPKKQGQKGQVVQVAMPMNISNVMLVCASCANSSRVGYSQAGGKKIRVCKKCGAEI